jgi:hypothetical protein
MVTILDLIRDFIIQAMRIQGLIRIGITTTSIMSTMNITIDTSSYQAVRLWSRWPDQASLVVTWGGGVGK